jgi:hypothetical protein
MSEEERQRIEYYKNYRVEGDEEEVDEEVIDINKIMLERLEKER